MFGRGESGLNPSESDQIRAIRRKRDTPGRLFLPWARDLLDPGAAALVGGGVGTGGGLASCRLRIFKMSKNPNGDRRCETGNRKVAEAILDQVGPDRGQSR